MCEARVCGGIEDLCDPCFREVRGLTHAARKVAKCTTLSDRAAAVNVPWSTHARKYSRCLSSTDESSRVHLDLRCIHQNLSLFMRPVPHDDENMSATATTPATTARLSRIVVFLFAVTAGSSAGCLYYLQPLLHEISIDLSVSTATAGLVVAITQIGYLIGLALVVPLGDFVNRRRLVTGLLAVSSLALVGAGLMPGYAGLLVMVFVVGVSASAAQVVVPWAAAIAGPGERGTVVGHVMSGLLIGILLSRVLSGIVAEVGGWRAILFVAAALQLTMAAAVGFRAPTGPAEATDTSAHYLQVLLEDHGSTNGTAVNGAGPLRAGQRSAPLRHGDVSVPSPENVGGRLKLQKS